MTSTNDGAMTSTPKDCDQLHTIAELCVEYWKLMNVARKTTHQLSETDGRRLAAQVNFSQKQLERLTAALRLRLVELTGEDFHAGVSASADNGEDFDDDEALVVTRTLEPIVVCDMRVVRTGRVLVGLATTAED